MYQVKKSVMAEKSVTEADLTAINALSRRELTAEEVYTFSVRACDDQPDRDYECFSAECIRQLAPMYVGKTVIFDHEWSARKQTARVYAAAVEKQGEATCLIAKVYMLRLPETESLIAAIDGGIIKEVSVGCSVSTATCSICGELYMGCEHNRGREYDGQTCIVILSDPTDAYELSFVAVPAQPRAGVQKAASEKMSINEADRAKARLLLEKLRYGGNT